MDPGDALRRTMARQDLSREETEQLFGLLMDGALADAHKAALLVALAMKGEAASEIAGAAAAMRRRVVPIPASARETLASGAAARKLEELRRYGPPATRA